MRCEVLAIGTELLLGQIVDTNSAWIGEQLAASGIDSYEHRVIGDNQTRIVEALRDLLSRSDAVLICGGHRADPGRPHARRDRRADGRAARAAHGARRAHRHDVPHPAARHAAEQPAPGRHARGRRVARRTRSAPRPACAARSATARSCTRCPACRTRCRRWCARR